MSSASKPQPKVAPTTQASSNNATTSSKPKAPAPSPATAPAPSGPPPASAPATASKPKPPAPASATNTPVVSQSTSRGSAFSTITTPVSLTRSGGSISRDSRQNTSTTTTRVPPQTPSSGSVPANLSSLSPTGSIVSPKHPVHAQIPSSSSSARAPSTTSLNVAPAIVIQSSSSSSRDRAPSIASLNIPPHMTSATSSRSRAPSTSSTRATITPIIPSSPQRKPSVKTPAPAVLDAKVQPLSFKSLKTDKPLPPTPRDSKVQDSPKIAAAAPPIKPSSHSSSDASRAVEILEGPSAGPSRGADVTKPSKPRKQSEPEPAWIPTGGPTVSTTGIISSSPPRRSHIPLSPSWVSTNASLVDEDGVPLFSGSSRAAQSALSRTPSQRDRSTSSASLGSRPAISQSESRPSASSSSSKTTTSSMAPPSHASTSGLRNELKTSPTDSVASTIKPLHHPPRSPTKAPQISHTKNPSQSSSLYRTALIRPPSPSDSVANSETSTASVAGDLGDLSKPKLSARLHRQFSSLTAHLENIGKVANTQIGTKDVPDLRTAMKVFNHACRQYYYGYVDVVHQIQILCPIAADQALLELIPSSFYAKLVVAEQDKPPIANSDLLGTYFLEIRTSAQSIYNTLHDYYKKVATEQKKHLDADDVTEGDQTVILNAEDLAPVGLYAQPRHASSTTLVPTYRQSRTVLGVTLPKAMVNNETISHALKRGDVKELVSVLIPDPEDLHVRIDEDLWDIVLPTYPFFLEKRSEFIPELIRRFEDVDQPIQVASNSAQIENIRIRRVAYQRRILRFITQWVKTDACFETTSEETREEVVQEFIAVLMFSADRPGHALKDMFKLLRSEVERRRRVSPDTCGIQDIAPWISRLKEEPKVKKWEGGSVDSVLKRLRGSNSTSDHKFVARHLTATVASLFVKASSVGLIQYWEWVRKVKNGMKELVANKTKMHDQCEALMLFQRQLQALVTYSVVQEGSSVGERASMIDFWLCVALVCKEHRDFSTAGTIFLGIDTTSIRRMGQTIKKVPFAAKRKYHKLAEVFGGDSADLRRYMYHFQEAVQQRRPGFFVPFIPRHNFRIVRETAVNPMDKIELYQQTKDGLECVTATKCPFVVHEDFAGWMYSAFFTVVPKPSAAAFEELDASFYKISKKLETESLTAEEREALWKRDAKDQTLLVGVFKRTVDLANMLSKFQDRLLARAS